MFCQEWKCRAGNEWVCRQQIDEVHIKWVAEMKLYISPFLLRRVPSSAFESPGNLFDTLEQVSRPFQVMDLPAELRIFVWSYTCLSWSLVLVNSDRAYEPGGPALLRVSRTICKEASPLIVFELKINEYVGRKQRYYIASLQRHLKLWEDASSLQIINNLSRIHFTMIAANDTELELNLITDQSHCVTLTDFRCRKFSARPWQKCEIGLEAKIQSKIEVFNGRREESTLRGLRLFEAIIANESNWYHHLSQNMSRNNYTFAVDDDDNYNSHNIVNYDEFRDGSEFG
jgi:hypothetical protein